MNLTPNEQLVEDAFDSRIQKFLAVGLLTGAGGMGLFHGLRKAKQKAEKLKTPAPNYSALATAPFIPEKLATQKAALDLDAAAAVGMPVLGAGAGALYNLYNAKKGKKLRSALEGAAVGGGIGALGTVLGTQHGARMLGAPLRAIENGTTLSGNGKPMPEGRGPGAESLNIVGSLLGGAAGVAAGGYAVDRLFDDEGEKERENVDKIQQARKEYFESLLADEKSAAVLDAAFDVYKTYRDKKSNDANPNASKLIWPFGPISDAIGNAGSAGAAAIMLGSLGAAGIGGTYMYNKTKDKSDAKQLNRARVARERLNTLPGAWIDPREVAHVKAMATGNQTANNA